MVHSSLITYNVSMIHVLKWVCPYKSKQQAAIPFFGNTKILHMLLSLGSTIVTAAVVLPRYGGLNRRFPEITGKDNLTVFSYSGRVKSPEWRWQLRRADLRQF